MMGFYHRAFSQPAFDYIRIDCSLYQIIYRTDFLCLFLKDTDKLFPDNLPLLLWIFHTGQLCIKPLLCIYSYKIQIVCSIRAEDFLYFIPFVFPKQTMVHKDTCELPSDCFC